MNVRCVKYVNALNFMVTPLWGLRFRPCRREEGFRADVGKQPDRLSTRVHEAGGNAGR